MNPLVPNRVALFASVATRPDVVAAARRLEAEGYELVVIDAGAPAAVIALAEAGVTARGHLGIPCRALEDLQPAVAVFGATHLDAGQFVPNRVFMGAASTDTSAMVSDNLDAWVEGYLAPRVPRRNFQRTRP